MNCYFYNLCIAKQLCAFINNKSFNISEKTNKLVLT